MIDLQVWVALRHEAPSPYFSERADTNTTSRESLQIRDGSRILRTRRIGAHEAIPKIQSDRSRQEGIVDDRNQQWRQWVGRVNSPIWKAAVRPEFLIYGR